MRSSVNVVVLIVVVAILSVSCDAISGANLETHTQHESRGTTMNDNRFLRVIPAKDEERGIFDFSKLKPKNWFPPKVVGGDFTKDTISNMKHNPELKIAIFHTWDTKTIEQIELGVTGANKKLNNKLFQETFADYVYGRISLRKYTLDDMFNPSMLKLMKDNKYLKKTVFDKLELEDFKQVIFKIGQLKKDENKMMYDYLRNRVRRWLYNDESGLFVPDMLKLMYNDADLRLDVFSRWNGFSIDDVFQEIGRSRTGTITNDPILKWVGGKYLNRRLGLKIKSDRGHILKKEQKDFLNYYFEVLRRNADVKKNVKR